MYPYTLIIPNISTVPSSIDWYLKFPPSYLLYPSYYSHARKKQRKEERKKREAIMQEDEKDMKKRINKNTRDKELTTWSTE